MYTYYYLHLFCFIQRLSITCTVQRALYIVAAFAIIDLIAVADVETLLGAVSPDRVLNKPRERPWKLTVELPGVDLLRDRLDDFGTAALPVAREAIGVVGSEPVQDSGPVQEIVHEGIDGNHAAADLDPVLATVRSSEQELGQGHHQHLVGDPVHLLERFDQRRSHSAQLLGS